MQHFPFDSLTWKWEEKHEWETKDVRKSNYAISVLLLPIFSWYSNPVIHEGNQLLGRLCTIHSSVEVSVLCSISMQICLNSEDVWCHYCNLWLKSGTYLKNSQLFLIYSSFYGIMKLGGWAIIFYCDIVITYADMTIILHDLF